MLWLLLAPVAYFALLYVGSPLGPRAPIRPNRIEIASCEILDSGIKVCNFILHRDESSPPVLLGRFEYNDKPKRITLDGKPFVLVFNKPNGNWVLVENV